jgi:hypothetical protein
MINLKILFIQKSLPEKWNNTKKLAMTAKQQVAPLQTNEVANIRRKTASFDVEQYNFRERFRQEAPFKYDSEIPYQKLDHVSFKSSPNYYQIFISNLIIIFSNTLKLPSWRLK